MKDRIYLIFRIDGDEWHPNAPLGELGFFVNKDIAEKKVKNLERRHKGTYYYVEEVKHNAEDRNND